MQNHRAKNSSSDFWNPELYVDWNWFQIFKNLYVEQKQGGKEGGGGGGGGWKFAAMIYLISP